MEDLLRALRAAGEPTRLKILAVLSRSELTVTELCRVLGQTQPRVSRHLRLLCDAGLLDRHSQGTSAFYRPSRSGNGRKLFDAVLPLINQDQPSLRTELDRLAEIRAERAEAAASYFEKIAGDWQQMRRLHVGDAEVEAAMLEAGGATPVRSLLDVGTGTGRVLELFADRIENGLGIDLSRQMLNLARSRLEQLGLAHCAVRHGNVYNLDLPAGSIDLAVLHHVLHFLDDPAQAVAEAARTLRPGGRLIVVDFAAHSYESMRSDYAHHWLGFTDADVGDWCALAGLTGIKTSHLMHKSDSIQDSLTVTVWVGTQNSDAPAVYNLEAAS